MSKWILRLWHRFTLGRTVVTLPGRYRDSAAPGSIGNVAYKVLDVALLAVPAAVIVTVASRTATDLERGHVRVVLEHNP